jgi:hypothetical protein
VPIKLEALVCRFCRYRFDAEDVRRDIESTQAGMGGEQSTVGVKGVGDAASDLKECPECHEMVGAGLDACSACSYGFRRGQTTPAVLIDTPAVPMGISTFTVVLDQISPPRRTTLKEILRTLQTRMSDGDIDAALEHPEVVIARDLSLQDANALMLKLHEKGFGPRKQRAAPLPGRSESAETANKIVTTTTPGNAVGTTQIDPKGASHQMAQGWWEQNKNKPITGASGALSWREGSSSSCYSALTSRVAPAQRSTLSYCAIRAVAPSM